MASGSYAKKVIYQEPTQTHIPPRATRPLPTVKEERRIKSLVAASCTPRRRKNQRASDIGVRKIGLGGVAGEEVPDHVVGTDRVGGRAGQPAAQLTALRTLHRSAGRFDDENRLHSRSTVTKTMHNGSD